MLSLFVSSTTTRKMAFNLTTEKSDLAKMGLQNRRRPVPSFSPLTSLKTWIPSKGYPSWQTALINRTIHSLILFLSSIFVKRYCEQQQQQQHLRRSFIVVVPFFFQRHLILFNRMENHHNLRRNKNTKKQQQITSDRFFLPRGVIIRRRIVAIIEFPSGVNRICEEILIEEAFS